MKKLFLICAVLGFAGVAKADLLVEPYLAYDMATVSATPIGGGDSGGKSTPIDMGLRLGYANFLGLFVAGDYQLAQEAGYKYNTSGIPDGKFSRTQGWLDVGYKFPILFRVWAGYALINELHIKDSSGNDGKFTGGTATKLGVGFTLLPLVELNVEYLMNSSYGTVESGGVSQDVSKALSSFNSTSVLVGVSLPLNL